jgi:osmotically-inducible protein OsmY
MGDYERNRWRQRPSDDNYESYGRRGGSYDEQGYGNYSQGRFGRSYDSPNRGYSSYGADDENPNRRRDRDEERYYRSNWGDQYEGNFSGSDSDRDYDFGMNRRGSSGNYGQYSNQDFRNNPNNLGVGSNYAYNRGGYGSNFGGEYGHFGSQDERNAGYSNQYGAASYSQNRRGWGSGNPDREYSSYSGRYDRDYERSWKRDNRDWMDRAGDEVASWFGDEDAERRRRMDKMESGHRGRGPKNYKRSDSRIEEDINDRLSDDGWVDASDIEVKVQDGEVTLTGTTPDRFSKRRAEDIAEAISGVKNVENRVRVSQENYSQAASYTRRDNPSGTNGATGSSTDDRSKARLTS